MVPNMLAAVMALPILALGALATRNATLPPCSVKNVPCSCPNGTVFKNITTYGVIGAPAKDLQAVMNDFYQTEWFGLTAENTTGKYNVVGATRDFNTSGSTSWYLLKEELTAYSTKPDGSFVQGYAQILPKSGVVNVPAAQGGGEYHGFWANLIVQQTVVANESAISFNVYRCDVGQPFNTALYHEANLRNVSSILKKQGKLTGVDIAPFSIFY